jgi:hypothetical protein
LHFKPIFGWIETSNAPQNEGVFWTLNPSSATAGKSKTPPQNAEWGIFRKIFGFGWIETV